MSLGSALGDFFDSLLGEEEVEAEEGDAFHDTTNPAHPIKKGSLLHVMGRRASCPWFRPWDDSFLIFLRFLFLFLSYFVPLDRHEKTMLTSSSNRSNERPRWRKKRKRGKIRMNWRS